MIRDVIRDKGMAALGRVVLTNREHPLLIEPFENGLLAETLRYLNEIRDARAYFEGIPELKLLEEMKELASPYRGSKAGHFNPARLEDHYEKALIELLQAKRHRREVKMPEGPPLGNVVNLMDASRAKHLAGESRGSQRPEAQAFEERAS